MGDSLPGVSTKSATRSDTASRGSDTAGSDTDRDTALRDLHLRALHHIFAIFVILAARKALAIFAAIFDPGEHRVFESTCHLRLSA